MKIPDEVELISLFESGPVLLDEVVPFYYNQATYIFSNKNNEQCLNYQSIQFMIR